MILPGDPTVIRLLEVTADSLHLATGAARTDDRSVARRLTRERGRLGIGRTLDRAAGTAGPERRLVRRLARVDRAVDDLLLAVTGGGAAALTEADVRDLELLGHAGRERLLRLAAGLDRPGTDGDYRRCGEELFSVLDRLAARGAWPGPSTSPAARCGDLTFAVLGTSRSATEVRPAPRRPVLEHPEP